MLMHVVMDGVDVPEGGSARLDHVGELLVDISTGDQRAFARLYDLLAPRVFGLILRIVGDRAQSEEVLQDVFLDVWQSADRYSPHRGQGRAWLLTIAHRRAVDRVRSMRASVGGTLARSGGGDTASQQTGLRLEAVRAAKALAALPEEQREAVTLAYFGGHRQSEIVDLVGATRGAVAARMRDGLSRLRTEMGTTS